MAAERYCGNDVQACTTTGRTELDEGLRNPENGDVFGVRAFLLPDGRRKKIWDITVASGTGERHARHLRWRPPFCRLTCGSGAASDTSDAGDSSTRIRSIENAIGWIIYFFKLIIKEIKVIALEKILGRMINL